MHSSTENCPHCGAPVRAGARFCRECGASDDSGWDDSESPEYAQGEDPDFDYQEFLDREFPEHASTAHRGWKVWVGIVIGLLLASMLLSSLF